MATRVKTIEFTTPTKTTTIAAATVTNLDQITVYIPETVISFRSVFASVYFHDIATTTATIGEHRVGLRLGSAGYTTLTETDDIANTGENISVVISPVDFTSHFTTNWTGTSMTCDIQTYVSQSTGAAFGVTNANAILTVTYEYNDDPAVNPTQIKTVYIPMESISGSLSMAANANFGSSQIPIISGSGGMLPERDVVIRDYAILIEGANTQTSSLSLSVSCSIDGSDNFGFAAQSGTLATSVHQRLIYKPTVPATGSAHNFQLWTDRQRAMEHITSTLQITYAFNASTTTQLLNSVRMPMRLDQDNAGATVASSGSLQTFKFLVPENNVTLRQSAVRWYYHLAGTLDLGFFFKAGSQSSYRGYYTWNTMPTSTYMFQHRIDSGSQYSNGITFARGENTLTMNYYIPTTARNPSGHSALLVLNYTSDTGSLGIGQNNHTIQESFLEWNMATAGRFVCTKTSVSIPETSYHFNSIGFFINETSVAGYEGLNFAIECRPTELKGGGYYDAWRVTKTSASEVGHRQYYINVDNVIKSNPYQVDNLDIEVDRKYIKNNNLSGATAISSIMTYHSYTWSTDITITNSAGGTVTVKVFRADTDELVRMGSRTGNGTITFIGFENTVDYYAVAYESATKLARSINFKFGD